MEYIKGWLKGILYVNVLLMLCESLLAKTKYEKYFRFFSGFLLMLCLIRPLLDLTSAGSILDASFFRSTLESELRLSEEYEQLQGGRSDFRNAYEEAVKKQITELGEEYDLEIEQISLIWNRENTSVTALSIDCQKKENADAISRISDFREALIQVYPVEKGNINIEMRD